MNRHQVLTGAANSGEHCFAVGSVEGVHFTAYAAGCDIVLLASDLQRVQIIPGAVHGNIQVTCIDCCTDAGKIAASYGNKVCIFEPTPLLHHDSTHKLDYQWYHTGTLVTEGYVEALSWNQDGSRLITGGDVIQMWVCPEPPGGDSGVEFFIDDHQEELLDWQCIWQCRPATPVNQLKFSPDGLLFASVGKADRLVKIWYENKKVSLPLLRMDSVSPKKEDLNYSFIYIAHPRAVTGFSWRKTSKYMPRGSVANMLITSCRDNICRLWVETILPEDGLVDLNQLDPNATTLPMFHTQRHRNRFMQRLHHIRNTLNKRKRHISGVGGGGSAGVPLVSTLPSAQSVHDFHKFGIHPNSVAPGFHFHLAASINPETDIPLLPAMSNQDGTDPVFVVHWLDNKELHFSLEADKLLADLHRRAASSAGGDETETNDSDTGNNDTDDGPDAVNFDLSEGRTAGQGSGEAGGDAVTARRGRRKNLRKSHSHVSTDSEVSVTSSVASAATSASHATDATVVPETAKATPTDVLDHHIERLLRDWHSSADMLFSVHPLDGSYLVWLVDWLDEASPGAFRQAQVSFSSRIPHAFPVGDAITMSTNLQLYCNHARIDLKAALKESESKSFADMTDKQPAPVFTANAMGKNSPGQSTNMLAPNVLMLSKHSNGSLNQWQISFAEDSRFTAVLSVAHASRVSGHRFRTNSAACHPALPLLLTTSHHNVPEMDNQMLQEQVRHQARQQQARQQEVGVAGGCSRHVMDSRSADPGPGGFCSELILWRVDPVGPLSKSGGLTELSRINSPEPSAFSNVAWVPTLLPSSTLGSFSNSPSALFVASDGASLRVYQAVIDARTLLTDFGGKRKNDDMSRSNSSSSSGYFVNSPPAQSTPRDVFNIVSLQSTARPGGIIELDTITNAKQDWQHIELIHIFQEQLVTGQRTSAHGNACGGGGRTVGGSASMEAIVDLQNQHTFEEHFYLVVMERLHNASSVLHMWRIVIASHGGEPGPVRYHADTAFFQDDDGIAEDAELSRSNTPDPPAPPAADNSVPQLTIKSSKVCTQVLELPEEVSVAYAAVAAGHLSSSSIYPACFAPYLITTACTDGRVRFWRCKASTAPYGEDMGGDGLGGDGAGSTAPKFEWTEWEMMIRTEESSAIFVPGTPITVSAAYSGRVAIAYRSGNVRSQFNNPNNKFVNLCVSIYECESTGGSEWTLEDTIELKNISLPDPKAEIDLRYIYNNDAHAADSADSSSGGSTAGSAGTVLVSPTMSTPAITKSTLIPSASTIQSIKRNLTVHDQTNNVLKQKHLVQLDWVSTEDGSHILTVGVGPKILLYAAVSSDIAQATQKDKKVSKPHPSRRLLQKSKSMTVQNFVEEIRWMKLRSIDLSTADGLPPLPMHISWVRDGILVVGMDNEMHVYSQWRGPGEGMDTLLDQITGGGSSAGAASATAADGRTLTEQSLHSSSALNLPKFKGSRSTSSIKLASSFSNIALMAAESTLTKRKDSRVSASAVAAVAAAAAGGTRADLSKTESLTSIHLIQDCGLFEASRLANPVLPQYHPKQLIELLNFGKIRRVKAILAHLVRCIAGHEVQSTPFNDDSQGGRQRMFSHQRALSVAAPASPNPEPTTIPEDIQLDYIEISSIPPLPLYALLSADDDTSAAAAYTPGPETKNAADALGEQQDYTALFSAENNVDDDLDDPFNDDEVFSTSPTGGSGGRDRRRSSAQFGANPNYFGPAQSRLLTRHLTHIQLPGLSSLDQMYLLALADTVANTSENFSNKEAADLAVRKTVDREQEAPAPISTEGIDDCGLRYTLAARHYVYLLNTLALIQRHQLQRKGLSPAVIAWAFHSEAEEELLAVIPSVQKGEPTWPELRQFGVGWWVRNINSLKKCMERVAKTAFTANKDPLDAALFYLAMKKKTLLWGLFRSVNDQKMGNFFKNNFSEDRWRRAALKNAFALLGRQRFEHAAGFFLLAGAVRDAIDVCLNKLEDLQLAMVIARLYESELNEGMSLNMKRLLLEECLGCDANGECYDQASAHPDPFIRSMAYWLLKDHSAALGTLLETNVGSTRRKDNEDDGMDTYSSNPSVFNFYNYLRTHPLLVRQHLAATAADTSHKVLLSGFTHGTQMSLDDKNITYIDRITPIERRLYFTTAHMHFKNGCPMLALEVLSKLPETMDLESDITKSRSGESFGDKSQIATGKLGEQAATTVGKTVSADTSAGFDWSQPVSKSSTGQTADAIDWSTPSMFGRASDMDWGQPMTKFDDEELDLTLDGDDGDTKSDSEIESKDKLMSSASVDNDGSAGQAGTGNIVANTGNTEGGGLGDIMAQQLKFIACLKIMMEELATLATGFEVDGGQLRFQLYIWLEREVKVLQKICKYGLDIVGPATQAKESTDEIQDITTDIATTNTTKSTLHEVIAAERLDFEAKQVRLAKRKLWLKAHQQLLRSLLSYSVLHGACGGGLASVRMELILLLQELQQEKTQQQLLSPLPFPTTLPLLSASVASSKTVIADPIRHLQSMTQDILHTVVEFTTPPVPNHMLNQVFVLRNLSAALSACIYQCLCDSDNFVVAMSDNIDVGMEGFTRLVEATSVVYKDSYLMAGAQRRSRVSSTDADDMPNSLPAKWPGVSSLRALLAREKDEDAPKLTILLAESLTAVYMCLLIYALAMYDANVLYRLTSHPFIDRMWPALFGGGVKKLIKVKTAENQGRSMKDEMSKHRMKLHMKVLGPTGSAPRLKEDKPTYKEKFVPPEVSMISYFMTKPFLEPPDMGVDYDSAESAPSSEEEEEEDELMGPSNKNDAVMNEHLDPNSYSWCLMRYAIVKYLRLSLNNFLPQIGIELPELPVCSPLMAAVLRTLEKWEELMKSKLDLFSGPPDDYIPGTFVDLFSAGPTQIRLRYKSMKEARNTPFQSQHYSAMPAKRLWNYLVNRDGLEDVFIRYIFKRKRPQEGDLTDSPDSASQPPVEPMKIIHKEHDIITAFCINQYAGGWTVQHPAGVGGGGTQDGPARANLNCVSVSTPKEVIEMDIGGILHPPVWLEDETEYDIESIRSPSPLRLEPEDFLLVSTPVDKLTAMLGGGGVGVGGVMPPTAPGVTPAPTAHTIAQTGRGGGVIKGLNIPGITNPHFSYYIVDRSRRLMRLLTKRQVSGVRRMGAHPHLPYYLTGSADGSVGLWEWGHNQCITVARQAGSFPKVSRVLFNAQGNKFGVGDAEGSLCLWQVGLGVNMNRPYLNLKCHSKTLTDFVFVGSSSFLATAGTSNDHRNICLFDTLLPQRSALIHGFSCHNDGAVAVLYAPQHQVIIGGGKKGDVTLFDTRQRQPRHSFQAHDSSIRSMALDPSEEFFITGSADGDIKVWGLTMPGLLHSFPGEHSKSSIFRNMGAGVTQIAMSLERQLFSCGADGSMKVRKLPDKDGIVASW